MRETKEHLSINSHLHRRDFPIGTKGVPADGRLEPYGYHLLDESLLLPIAVLNERALNNNLNWMAQFATQSHVKLAPHGKTTMMPALFAQQMAHGAWGITVATVAQAQAAAMSGAERIMLANQLIGKANMAVIADLYRQGTEVIVWADNEQQLMATAAYFAEQNIVLKCLVEIGVDGGRCGCRSEEQVKRLAKLAHALPNIALQGIAFYEGVIGGESAEHDIREFVTKNALLLSQIADREWIDAPTPIITGAGSAWYDVVADALHPWSEQFEVILRPGCYLIHDKGIYQDAQNAVADRATTAQRVTCSVGQDLESALELWAYVQSCPETNMAIINVGKRDAAFDAGLPHIERVYRDGKLVNGIVCHSEKIMDQHLMVNCDKPLQVGDIVVMSTSHPCLTLDKWRYVAVCNDELLVTHWLETAF
uniref:alanine racemase n=1 Tax=Thaumasiovibrio occultus TaxID=1891184 RepID=UPI000B36406A|nr:alanine racemase [Thaumasiovibrio occultus]